MTQVTSGMQQPVSPTAVPSVPGAATSACTNVSAENGLSTDKILLITGGSAVAAGLVGAGIYHYKKAAQHPKTVEAYGEADSSGHIGDMNRLFQKMTPHEQNTIVVKNLDRVQNTDELAEAKFQAFVFTNGKLSGAMEQAFAKKFRYFGLHPGTLDFAKPLEEFKASTDEKKRVLCFGAISNLKFGFLSNRYRDLLKIYYNQFLKPHSSPSLQEYIKKIFEKELYLHLA